MKQSLSHTIVLGSRPSRLARWQTAHIMGLLTQAWPGLSCQVKTMVTAGDRNLDQPLPEIGGKGLFTEELETALRSGEIDLAVHSLKDLPVEDPAGLCIGAVSLRACAQDVLVSTSGRPLAQLPQGAVVGTSSLRREVQLKARRPDLNFQSIRGNVETRIRKVMDGQYDATILAAAGLERLEMQNFITEYLSYDTMLPAPGQAALAVQCRADDRELLELLQRVHHVPSARSVTAERSFLAALGGGCSAPVAAYAMQNENGLELSGMVGCVASQQMIHLSSTGSEPQELGARLAQMAFAQGAAELLK